MEPITSRVWLPRNPPSEDTAALSSALDIPGLAALILAQRNLTEDSQVAVYLEGSLADLPDPSTLPGMTSAAERVARAVIAREPVMVHGDYDVDGITGTALLVDFLRQCDAVVDYHIPLRLRDGYGLSGEALKAAAAGGVKLVISVDCGISALAEAELARQLGLDLVITDHHQPGETLPVATALVNPCLEQGDFPDNELAGVGVAFFLAVAVRRWLRSAGHFKSGKEPDLRTLLDLAALGTVADVVPLRKVNRLLVKKGLEWMTQAPRCGIAALLEISGVTRVSCGSVGFQLAPRLNAAGRLEDAALGVELLLSEDRVKALETARQLDLFNRERREIEHATLDEAIEMVCALPESNRSIVLSAEHWHPGVIGIVASRLVERYHRPTLLIACSGGVGKGSARSVPGFHLYSALCSCASHLEGFGGHAAAAGFSLQSDLVGVFAQAFEAVCQGDSDLVSMQPRIRFDVEAELTECDMSLATTLERFAPFGAGNPEPLVCVSNVQVQQLQTLNGGHLRFTARQEGMTLPCIAFSMAERQAEFASSIDLLAAVQVNRWNGRQSVQLVVKDVRPVEGGA